MNWCFVASDFNWQPLPLVFSWFWYGLVFFSQQPRQYDNMFGFSVILYRKFWKWACQQRVIKNWAGLTPDTTGVICYTCIFLIILPGYYLHTLLLSPLILSLPYFCWPKKGAPTMLFASCVEQTCACFFWPFVPTKCWPHTGQSLDAPAKSLAPKITRWMLRNGVVSRL